MRSLMGSKVRWRGCGEGSREGRKEVESRVEWEVGGGSGEWEMWRVVGSGEEWSTSGERGRDKVQNTWCPLVRDKVFCLWDKCEFLFACPLGTHFWTSDTTHLFFQFFPTCPKDKRISIFFSCTVGSAFLFC